MTETVKRPLPDWPEPIKLDEEDQVALRRVAERQQALREFIQSITDTGEARMREVRTEGQSAWQKIASKHGLDLDEVAWEPTNDFSEIRPIALRAK